jgi:hypothetical protein
VSDVKPKVVTLVFPTARFRWRSPATAITSGAWSQSFSVGGLVLVLAPTRSAVSKVPEMKQRQLSNAATK